MFQLVLQRDICCQDDQTWVCFWMWDASGGWGRQERWAEKKGTGIHGWGTSFISVAVQPHFQTLLSTRWVEALCVGKNIVIIANMYWTLHILSTLLTDLIPVTIIWDARVQRLTPQLLNCKNMYNFSFVGEPSLAVDVNIQWDNRYNIIIIVLDL